MGAGLINSLGSAASAVVNYLTGSSATPDQGSSAQITAQTTSATVHAATAAAAASAAAAPAAATPTAVAGSASGVSAASKPMARITVKQGNIANFTVC